MSTYNPWKNVTLNENVNLGMETSGEDTNNLNANFLEVGFIVAEVSPFDCDKGFYITVCDGTDSDDSFFPGNSNHVAVPTAQQAHDIVVALSACKTFDECKALYSKLIF